MRLCDDMLEYCNTAAVSRSVLSCSFGPQKIGLPSFIDTHPCDFPVKEDWVGYFLPGDLSDPGIGAMSPCLAGGLPATHEPSGKLSHTMLWHIVGAQ